MSIPLVEKLNHKIQKSGFFYQQRTVFIKLFQKKAKITIVFLLKNPKNNNIILVIKGQINPKADWRAIYSLKIRINEFGGFFCHDSLDIFETRN